MLSHRSTLSGLSSIAYALAYRNLGESAGETDTIKWSAFLESYFHGVKGEEGSRIIAKGKGNKTLQLTPPYKTVLGRWSSTGDA